MGVVRSIMPRPLADHVEFLWAWQGYAQPHAAERVLPTGRMGLILALDDQTPADGAFSGAYTRPIVLDTSRPLNVIGAAFKLGGAVPFLDFPASELQDRTVSPEIVWGAAARRLRDRLLEADGLIGKLDVLESFLLARLRGAVDWHAAVRYALDAFRHPSSKATVASVVAHTGLSPRRFIAAFRTEVGLAPKTFCRIARFRRAIDAIESSRDVDWADVALSCGYFDQAHLIHDFREFAGVTPSTYLRERTSTNHVRVEP